ncbi:MAG: zf-HC2 domain-containing protein [Rhodococcus sp. (in: high G+C Gram-positive bacteria)]
MSSAHDEIRPLLGAYVLDGLERDDRAAVRRHLDDCLACRTEIDVLAPVAGVLRRRRQPADLSPVHSTAGADQRLDHLLSAMRHQRTSEKRRRRVWTAVSATLVLGVAASIVPLSTLARSDDSTTVNDAGARPLVLSSTVGATGDLELTTKAWGTSIDVDVQQLPGAGILTLQVVGNDGTRQQAAQWSVTASRAAAVTGATSLSVEDIHSIVIDDPAGNTIARASR